MTSLITLLISLLGYGTPADFDHYTEDQLNAEIATAQAAQEEEEAAHDGGGWDGWDQPGVDEEPTQQP